jgi:hypothetical protein
MFDTRAQVTGGCHDYALTLMVVETYQTTDDTGLPVTRENKTTKSVSISLHNSRKEVSEMAYHVDGRPPDGDVERRSAGDLGLAAFGVHLEVRVAAQGFGADECRAVRHGEAFFGASVYARRPGGAEEFS